MGSKMNIWNLRPSLSEFEFSHIRHFFLLVRMSLCGDLKSSVDNLSSKIELVTFSTTPSASQNMASSAGHHDDNEVVASSSAEQDFEMALTGFESDFEQQIVKLFRRLSLPFKKANRRLRDMEDIGRQLESTMGEIRTTVQIANADFDRKFGDFFNMTLEMFEHQHHQSELGEKTLAGIKLCCAGTASDLSDFKAKTEAVLDMLRQQMPDESNYDPRSSASIRFDSERILSVLKHHENLLIDGFDKKCSSNNIEAAVKQDDEHQAKSHDHAAEITLSSTEILEVEPTQVPPPTNSSNAIDTVLHLFFLLRLSSI